LVGGDKLVYENIEKLRKAKGITKTHIANVLEMSLMGYSHIESGSSRLDVERLKIIAKALNVEANILLDDKLTKSVIVELETHSG
jgi:transcriptional regulator with XRE-family HTH domain